jgi:HPt (histidine-containing phosphotransfer) domain-containing protein
VTAETKVEVINPPNTLKSKIIVGGPGAVDPKTLERAESVIAGMSDNYLKSVQDDMVRISAAFERLKSGAGNGSTPAIEEIFQISHDVKGQGGSFGYPLLTAIGNELCRLIEKLGNDIGASEIEAIRIHIDAMKLVVSERMKGDGGKQGKTLLVGLQQMCDKLLQK